MTEGDDPAPRPRVSLGTALGIGWLTAVAGIALAQALHHGPRDANLAATPARLASGRLWPLVTSAFVVAGQPFVQLAATALLLTAVVRLHGAGVFWLAAAAGHIGATLVTYAGVGLVWLVSRADVDSVVEAPDYGISAVWSAALGALAISAAATPRWRRITILATVVCLAALVTPTPLDGDLAGVEHVVAFGLGAAVTRWRLGLPRDEMGDVATRHAAPGDGRRHRGAGNAAAQ